MKKILSLSLILVLLAAAAMAQDGSRDFMRKQNPINGFQDGQLTRTEKTEWKYNRADQYDRRDRIITPRERRRLHRIECRARRNAIRHRHHRMHGSL